MTKVPAEDELTVILEADDDAASVDPAPLEEGGEPAADHTDGQLQRLRDEFVDGFNSRDLESILAIVDPEVECPDIAGDGAAVLAEELESIWDHWPGAILTRGYVDGSPCGVAWLPDEDGCWSRAALVTFDNDDGLLTLVTIPDDADTLDRVDAEDPTGEELEEWSDWSEWERGEETVTRARDRGRP